MADVDIEKKLTTNHAYGISALVLVMCWCIYPFEASSLGKSGNLFLIFVIALVSCITFFNFFKKIQLPEFLATYFSEIGKYTLVLYLVPVLILPAKTFVLNGQVTFASESLIILSIVQCFVDMAEWISFALSMAVNIVVGLVCGFLLKCCFHRRRFIRVTVVAYWITYVIATVVIDIGESKNIFELLIILLLVMFSALVFR